jgi:hypothetical protein
MWFSLELSMLTITPLMWFSLEVSMLTITPLMWFLWEGKWQSWVYFIMCGILRGILD